MAEFNILDHLDKLTPDGGKDRKTRKGLERTYECPSCGAHNFLGNHDTGEYLCTAGCETRKVRDAINPPRKPAGEIQKKAIRPQQFRHWDYFTDKTLERGGGIALTVHRTDDGQGGRKIWQHSRIDGFEPAAVGEKVLPYGIREARQALENGERWIFWVEGEPCVDALRSIGLTAITSLGGSGNFRANRDGGHIPPDRLCNPS